MRKLLVIILVCLNVAVVAYVIGPYFAPIIHTVPVEQQLETMQSIYIRAVIYLSAMMLVNLGLFLFSIRKDLKEDDAFFKEIVS